MGLVLRERTRAPPLRSRWLTDPRTRARAALQDAADQSALSRIWGGIHPPQDDLPSRGIADVTGPAAFAFAQAHW